MIIARMIAEGIGWVIITGLFLLFWMALVVAIHDFMRARIPKYDLYFYDDARRWNRKRRNQTAAPIA